MKKQLGFVLALMICAMPAMAQRVIETGPIGPPINPDQVIRQQNQPQNLPPAMAPQPYEFRNPSSGPYPQVNPYGGSSYRARQTSRARYQCAQRARRMKKSRRAAYINECVAAR